MDKPESATEWFVTSVELAALELPYAVDVPYSTCEVLATSVVQEIVAPVVLIPCAVTPLIAGAGVPLVPWPCVKRKVQAFCCQSLTITKTPKLGKYRHRP